MLIIQQYAIKYKMSTIKDFESTELLKIYLTEKQFNACKVDRNEINLNGKLYDIIFSAFKNGKFELTVFHDEEEETVLKEIANFFKYRCKPNQKLPFKVNQLLLANYIMNDIGFRLEIFNFTNSSISNRFFSLNVRTQYRSIFLPPPRLI
jgi:hypothetical protein